MRLALKLLVLPIIALLTACGTNSGEAAAEGPASGEVLGGETSDAMLPLDTARSTSPVAPRTGSVGGSAAAPAADGKQVEEAPNSGAGDAPEPAPATDEPPAGEPPAD